MLTIYNSLTRRKEIFTPITPGKINLYVCGMTVYDYCHIGHARTMVVFDIIVRFFRYADFDVTYVRNITDVDDKIIDRANKNQESMESLTERFIHAMHEDEKALGIASPDKEPRATEFMSEMLELIEKLLSVNMAYVADNGDVYFDVKKFQTYGKLSNKDLDSLMAGARVDIVEAKQNPLDFVLWKMAKPNEPAWDSPWGKGRPGWHSECVAMSTKTLGKQFDIHGGGMDLKFPHHENEIAQSEGAHGGTFVNYWIHSGFVQINKEKMSKSLNNFFTIREVLEKYRPEVIRYFLMSSHYRSPVDFSEENLKIAEGALNRFYTSLRGLTLGDTPEDSVYEKEFRQCMEDDFNTPEALAVLFQIAHEINRLKGVDDNAAGELGALLKRLASIFGLLTLSPEEYFQQGSASQKPDTALIENYIRERELARQQRDWAKADKIRDTLLEMGVLLEDSQGTTQWRYL